MKIYISADIEGITGITHWDEATHDHADYGVFREQMTAEVTAAVEGALEAGATEVLVKDAHDTARNLIASKLPQEIRLVRGWSGHPYIMMQEMDKTFDGALMIGYHSRAGSNTNPLAHTLTGGLVEIRINDRPASEFLINTYTAAMLGVPVLFVSGDKGLCEEAKSIDPQIETVAVKEGIGKSTLSIHPQQALIRIQDGVKKALVGGKTREAIQLPDHFSVEIQYKDHFNAYRYSFFPGAELKNSDTIRFVTDHYFEVLRLLLFTT